VDANALTEIRRSVCVLFLTISSMLVTHQSLAFDKAGHFHSAARILSLAMPAYPQEARVISFCAQLPDEVVELDAAEQAWGEFKTNPFTYASWGLGNKYDDPKIQNMILVQRLQHVLTGSPDAAQIQKITASTFQMLSQQAAAKVKTPAPDANEALCALGLAMHAVGDSFAHVDMDSGDDPQDTRPRAMYVTGRGHAAHQHYPDYPLCEIFNGIFAVLRHCTVEGPSSGYRGNNWRQQYWLETIATVATAFNPAGTTPPAFPSNPANFIHWLGQQCANDKQKWCELEIRHNADADASKVLGGGFMSLSTWLDDHKLAKCEDTIAQAWALRDSKGSPALPGKAPLCATSWVRYRRVAESPLQAIAKDIPLSGFPNPWPTPK